MSAGLIWFLCCMTSLITGLGLITIGVDLRDFKDNRWYVFVAFGYLLLGLALFCMMKSEGYW